MNLGQETKILVSVVNNKIKVLSEGQQESAAGSKSIGVIIKTFTETEAKSIHKPVFEADIVLFQVIRRMCTFGREGHQVIFYRVIPDDEVVIRETVITLIKENAPHIVILTGGTGVSSQDVTIEAVSPLFRKELTAFGPLFAQLSFESIDSAAVLSRATAGIMSKSVIFCIPGSLKACKLACNMLIFPEMGHLVKHVYKG